MDGRPGADISCGCVGLFMDGRPGGGRGGGVCWMFLDTSVHCFWGKEEHHLTTYTCTSLSLSIVGRWGCNDGCACHFWESMGLCRCHDQARYWVWLLAQVGDMRGGGELCSSGCS